MVLYGASGHCKVIIDILEAQGIQIDHIVDDSKQNTEILGYRVKSNVGCYDNLIISIGSSEIRKKIAESLTVKNYIRAIHPSAIISPRASIGEGSVVMQGAIIQSCAEIGKHCIVNTGASVDHDVKIEDFSHVAPHATLAGNVSIGEGSWIGAGAVVKQGVTIGKWTIIGAGAVVIKDVPDKAVVAGVPARIIKYKE